MTDVVRPIPCGIKGKSWPCEGISDLLLSLSDPPELTVFSEAVVLLRMNGGGARNSSPP